MNDDSIDQDLLPEENLPDDSDGQNKESEEIRRRRALRSILSASTLLVVNPFLVGADSGNFLITVTPSTSITPSVTSTPPASPSLTASPSLSPSVTSTPTASPSLTPSVTNTPSPSLTPSVTSTPTASPSLTPSVTNTPSTSVTPTSSVTPTTSFTPTSTATPTPTPSASSVPLPVEISEFGVVEENGVIKLFWKTETERNNRGFEIQRSTNTFLFSQIGWVDGAGDTNSPTTYNFEEIEVEPNRWYYYRLKQLDYNGTSHFSKTVAVMMNQEEKVTLKKVSPTIVTDSFVNVEITSGKSVQVELSILDLLGQLVTSKRALLRKGHNIVRIEFGGVSSGIYIVQMKLENGSRQSRKFMVER